MLCEPKPCTILIAFLVVGAALASAPAVSLSADGVVLKTFTTGNGLRNNWIKGVFRDGDRLLVTHVAGTDLYEPFDRKFVPFEPPAVFKGGRITGIAGFGGKTYVGTEAALNVREGGKWTSLDRHQQVVHNEEVLTASPTALYAAARVMFGGVLRFDGTTWTIVNRGTGTGIMNNATSILARGEELFIGTTTNALLHFDGKEWRVVGPDEGLPGIWVTSLAVSDEGVWVGCFHGLALMADGKITRFTAADGLPSNKITSLKVVKGKLVVGTMDQGVSIRTGKLFVNVNTQNGLTDNRVEAIEAADEGAWVGTVNGLNLVEVR